MNRTPRAVTLAGIALLIGGCTSDLQPAGFAPPSAAVTPPPPLDAVPAPAMATNDFNGKFIALSYVAGDEVVAAVLQSPTIKKLGSRDFFVGDVVAGDGRTGSPRKRAVGWIPVDSAESLLVFENKDDAVRESADDGGRRM